MCNPPQSTANNSISHTSEIRPDESQRVNAKIQSVRWKELDVVEWSGMEESALSAHTHACTRTHKHAFYHSLHWPPNGDVNLLYVCVCACLIFKVYFMLLRLVCKA